MKRNSHHLGSKSAANRDIKVAGRPERTAKQTVRERTKDPPSEATADEGRFRDLLEALPDAMVLVDRNGRIMLVNDQTEKLFGYKRDELIGKPVEILVPEHLRGAHVAHRTDYYSKPRMRVMASGLDLYGRRKDGSQFPVEISLSPLETNEGLLVTGHERYP